MKSPLQKRVLLLFFLWCCTAGLFSESRVDTFRQSGAFVTEGWIDIDVPPERALSVIADIPRYREWIFRGLDGSDPESVNFLGIFRDFIPESEGLVSIVYDVNLIWPFGSTGNYAVFIVNSEEALGTMDFFSASPTIAYESANLYAEIAVTEAAVRANFTLQMKFSWIIEPFMTVEGFKNGIEWRLKRISRNFMERCQTLEILENGQNEEKISN